MNGKTALVSLFLTALLSIPAIPWIADTEADLLDEGSLQPHDPIVIEGDDDFTAANGVRAGSGTEADPYLIENWTINAYTVNGISIIGTSQPVIIRNCRINGIFLQNNNSETSLSGIYIERSTNITLSNDLCTGNYRGMFVYRSSDILLSENEITLNKWAGIEIMRSHDIEVENNHCSNQTRSGIFINIVNDSVVKENICTNNEYGIEVSPHADDTHIQNWETRSWRISIINNSCHGNGIIFEEGNQSLIKNNFCSDGSYSTTGSNEICLQNNIAIGGGSLGVYNMQNSLYENNEFDDSVYYSGSQRYQEEDTKKYYQTNEFINNFVKGKPLRVIKNENNISVINNNVGEIILVNSSDVRISEIEFQKVGLAIFGWSGARLVIDNCSFKQVARAINVYNDLIVIKDCTFTDSKQPPNAKHQYLSVQVGGDRIYVERNIFNNVQEGIWINNRIISSIKNNQFMNVLYCIDACGYDTIIENNTLTEGIGGIRSWVYAYDEIKDSVNIENNYIDSFSEFGIKVFQDYIVQHNTITNCINGIFLTQEPGNGLIYKNFLISNEYGIRINGYYDATYIQTKIFQNNISFSEKYAMIYEHSNPYSPYSDIIFKNSFYENNKGGVQVFDKCRYNLWNESQGGNFWSDYSSRYPNATLLGNYWTIPYAMEGNNSNRDNYPLVSDPTGSVILLKLYKVNLLKAIVGVQYVNTYRAAYTGEGELLWSFSTDAKWLSFTQDHTLSGTPSEKDIGLYWINISVTDDLMSDFTNFTIVVEIKNFPPVITTSDVTSINQWQLYRVDYNATDSEADLEWRLVVDGIDSFLEIDPQTGVLSGTPGLNDVGTVHVNISVNDGQLYAIHHFDLTVKDVNDPPMMNGSFDHLFMDEDSTLVLTIGEVFFNYDHDPMTVTATASGNVTCTVGSSIITIEPDLHYFGNETIRFMVSDGHYEIEFSSMLAVRSVNDPPSGLQISFGQEIMIEGGAQIIWANFSDVELDDLNVTWLIDGVIAGYGPLLNLSLSEGTYNITLRVTDENGAYSELSRTLVIEGKIVVGEHDPPYLLLAIIGLFIIMVIIGSLIFILRRRSRGEEPSIPSITEIEGHAHTPMDKDLPLAPAPSMTPVKIGSLDGDTTSIPTLEGTPVDYELDRSEYDLSRIRRKLNMMQDDGDLTVSEHERIVDILDRIEE